MRRERKHLQDVLEQAIVKVREANQMRLADLALRNTGTRMLMVDEFQHFFDNGTRLIMCRFW